MINNDVIRRMHRMHRMHRMRYTFELSDSKMIDIKESCG